MKHRRCQDFQGHGFVLGGVVGQDNGSLGQWQDQLGSVVAEVKHMSHAYRSETSQNRLFDDVELFIEKGDRIAVLGPNGSGKSTFLRLLVGKENPDDGSAEWRELYRNAQEEPVFQ